MNAISWLKVNTTECKYNSKMFQQGNDENDDKNIFLTLLEYIRMIYMCWLLGKMIIDLQNEQWVEDEICSIIKIFDGVEY